MKVHEDPQGAADGGGSETAPRPACGGSGAYPRHGQCHRQLAAGVSRPFAPLLLAGTGSDRRHLVIVTSDGLAGGFQFQHHPRRARRSPARPATFEGKDIRSSPSTQKQARWRAPMPLWRQSPSKPGRDQRHQLPWSSPSPSGVRIAHQWRIRCGDPGPLRLQVGGDPDPRVLQLIPAKWKPPAGLPPLLRSSRTRPPSCRRCCPARIFPCSCSPALLENQAGSLPRR